ncbi:hypothetical protein B0H14DRAFT_2565064 [Mycena olivaceomarginata]|nr:hypothetical protein B0H14DRAFT_2565064 [Mycena olivaceomarginata]
MLGAPSIFNWNVGCSQPKIVERSQVCKLSTGALISPTEGSWEHPASSTGSIQGITERLLGASGYITWVVPSLQENMVGGSQDYYKKAPTTVRRFHEYPECRIVVNPAEEGNAFYATEETYRDVPVSLASKRVRWRVRKFLPAFYVVNTVFVLFKQNVAHLYKSSSD